MTQNERLVDYMRRHGSVTTIEASRELGVTQLAARIIELQRMGFKIGKERRKARNRFGEESTVVAYSIARERE